MRRRPTCHRVRSATMAGGANRWPRSSRIRYGNTLSSTDFIRRRGRDEGRATRTPTRRQRGCMAETERRRKAAALPKPIALAVRAAEDKKAEDIAVLDLRKASGFTDHFVICS